MSFSGPPPAPTFLIVLSKSDIFEFSVHLADGLGKDRSNDSGYWRCGLHRQRDR